MTLEEAIKHFEEVAKFQRSHLVELPKLPDKEREECIKCAEEHEQLAEWLKELKALKEAPKGDLISREALKKKLQARHDNGEEDFDKGYNIGIETAIELLDNAPTVDTEKVLVANVTFDEDKLKEIVQTEVIDKIKNGELVIKGERSKGEWVFKTKSTFPQYQPDEYKCPFCSHIENRKTKFCCECGADMRGGDKNDE